MTRSQDTRVTLTSHLPASPRMGLLDVSEIRVPLDIARHTHAFLQERGVDRLEAVGFWAGIQQDSVFEVCATVIPDQHAQSSKAGAAVVIGGAALFDLNVALHRKGWTLVAQIHSHPQRAYHSETDDMYSVVTRVGAISIVVPDFAVGPLDSSTWAVYRLDENAQWRQLTRSAGEGLIHLVA